MTIPIMPKQPAKRGRGRPMLADRDHPIVKRRLAKGWTRARLAEATGLALVTVNKAEADDRHPDLSTVRAIAKALGVGVETLAVELLLRHIRRGE